MAPRQRDPPPPGILASAFSFVSREIESFVTAATGGDVEGKIQPRPHASTSRVTLDLGVPSTDNSHECEKDVKKKHVQDGTGREAVRSRKRRPVHSDNESESSSRVMRRKSPCHADFSFVSIGDDLQHKESSLQASTSRTTLDAELSKRDDRGGPDRRKRARKISDSDPLQKCKPRARTNESDADDETDSPSARSPSSKSSRVGDNVTIHKASPAPSRSPSPVPLPLNIPRSTMPGSLFPRSPSLMPDTPSPGYIARRVRFIPPSSLSASVEEPTEEPCSRPFRPRHAPRRAVEETRVITDG
ncbi:hypothetical protein A0H81_07510 [Grifola frondosa]|uniref:Uncharacterized protein n=1 Tax=Grifola frondosa TaxID=5627 RepID=A0A1C7M824_GRIFR|nr:hypothetical protein A0H81_07510 [Grifola frondosa]